MTVGRLTYFDKAYQHINWYLVDTIRTHAIDKAHICLVQHDGDDLSNSSFEGNLL